MENRIVSILKDLGFASVGFLNQRNAVFTDWIASWLDKGCQAEMTWLGFHRKIRMEPCSIFPAGRSIISATYPYYTETPAEWGDKNPISHYAWGADYHKVLKKRLVAAIRKITDIEPEFKARAFVDTAPIPEKIVGSLSGLGWIGKNSLLLNTTYGSYFFLGEIVCNLDLESSFPQNDKCGECSNCIDACPNGAIQKDRTIDARKCNSYLTIEKRGEFNEVERRQIDYHLFGCDICQQVCPWNGNLPVSKDTSFQCYERWKGYTPQKMAELDQSQFDQLKIGSPIKRLKLDNLKRNARAILANR